MADDRHRRDYPSPNLQQPSGQPYPYPSPSEHSRHGASTPSNMASSVTLPSIHDTRPGSYGAPPPHPSQGRAYPDHRYEAPRDSNGYPTQGHQQPPPGHQPGPPPPGSHLPPPPPHYAHPDPRSPAYPPPPHDQRGYYSEQRPTAPYPPHEQYRQEAYYYTGPPPPGAYAPPYPGQHAHMQYGPPGHQQPQAAPRQRTSIACKYCRKRKIRCSGYSTAPGGKCHNCSRMNQECVFQPVSSSNSAAFIPVSAVPGGVPPGTPLYGAYGQPLASAHYPPGPPGHHPPGGHPPPPGPPQAGPPPGQHPHHAPPYYQHSAHSPTESYSSYGDVKHEDGSAAGRRRRRTSEEHDEGYRLPPPRASGEDDPRRRSPAEFSNHSSPSGFGHSKVKPESRGGPPQPPSQSTASNPPAPGGRSPGVATGSSGTSTPAPAAHAGAPPSQSGSSSVMSLSNLVDKNDIDSGMLSRLNRTKSTGSPHSNSHNGSR